MTSRNLSSNSFKRLASGMWFLSPTSSEMISITMLTSSEISTSDMPKASLI